MPTYSTEITKPKRDKVEGEEFALISCNVRAIATDDATGLCAGHNGAYEASGVASPFVNLAAMTKEDRKSAIINIVENDPEFSEALTELRGHAAAKLEALINPNIHAGTFEI